MNTATCEEKRWHVGVVNRQGAMATMYAPLDKNGNEHGITPSYDRMAMQHIVNHLNGVPAVKAAVFEPNAKVTLVRTSKGYVITIEDGDGNKHETPITYGLAENLRESDFPSVLRR